MENQRVSSALLMHTAAVNNVTSTGSVDMGAQQYFLSIALHMSLPKKWNTSLRKSHLYQISQNPSSGSGADTHGQTDERHEETGAFWNLRERA
jgi:hypothetical protein